MSFISLLGVGQRTAPNIQPASVSDSLPAFDAATIKPPDPKASGRLAGFHSNPGGRIFFGGRVKWLVEFAFGLQDYQVSEGPGWIDSQWFEINAVPPESSLSKNIKLGSGQPTPEQRLMLQSLLRDRFGFKFHFESKEGDVYILTRGGELHELKPPKDPTAIPSAVVYMKLGGIVDGEADGTNTTTDNIAQRLSGYLRRPVLNETGITGSYDFHLPPQDPDNQDFQLEVFRVVDRLGLQIRRGRGPVQILVIDRVEQPSEN
jgi:uncharacterized protein (TIGR03435 family)